MIEIREGAELDCAIAQAIGLVCTHRALGAGMFFIDPKEGTHAAPALFRPSTNLNDAFRSAEAVGLFTIVRYGPEMHLAKTIDGQWEILTGGSEMGYVSREATPALAICAAILKTQQKTIEQAIGNQLKQLYYLRLEIDTWLNLNNGPMPREIVVEIHEKLLKALEKK